MRYSNVLIALFQIDTIDYIWVELRQTLYISLKCYHSFVTSRLQLFHCSQPRLYKILGCVRGEPGHLLGYSGSVAACNWIWGLLNYQQIWRNNFSYFIVIIWKNVLNFNHALSLSLSGILISFDWIVSGFNRQCSENLIDRRHLHILFSNLIVKIWIRLVLASCSFSIVSHPLIFKILGCVRGEPGRLLGLCGSVAACSRIRGLKLSTDMEK
jgi:hypothetical protein